jgi:hypothetical protein
MFKVADIAENVKKERPFESLIAFGMATLTAKDKWDNVSATKFSELAIAVANDILEQTDQIDELFEWL